MQFCNAIDLEDPCPQITEPRPVAPKLASSSTLPELPSNIDMARFSSSMHRTLHNGRNSLDNGELRKHVPYDA